VIMQPVFVQFVLCHSRRIPFLEETHVETDSRRA
jgi:hypothetical protein